MTDINDMTPGEHVLLLGVSTAHKEDIELQMTAIKSAVTDKGSVALEQFDRIETGTVNLPPETYDRVLCGLVGDGSHIHGPDMLSKLHATLKTKGRIVLLETLPQESSEEAVQRRLKLSGFIDVQTQMMGPTVRAIARKPDYSVGASMSLKLGGGKTATAQASVWKMDVDDDLDDDLVMEESLLTEEDLAMKGTAPARSDCATKKRACKNCTCGRAEAEAAGAASAATPAAAAGPLPASSCGNCYLGDAFRCASCPYKGMPAFKPGDKIVLSAQQMKPDT